MLLNEGPTELVLPHSDDGRWLVDSALIPCYASTLT